MNYSDLAIEMVGVDLKAAYNHADKKDFTKAKIAVVDALKFLYSVEEHISKELYKKLRLDITKMDEEVKELEEAGDDFIKSWYASSAGGSIIRDYKAGRVTKVYAG